MEMIVLENVVKMYENGKRAVNELRLTVRSGEHILITGAAGSGKTTLLKLIAGVQPPSAGRIVVDSRAVHEMKEETAAAFRNKTFGILPRHPGFADTLTITENIALPLAIRKIRAKERNQMAITQMNLLGIGRLVHSCPPMLSGLELQLASLARALAARPKILLLDDIETDLTEKENAKLQCHLNAVLKCGGLTTVRFTDNDMGDASYDRRYWLRYGKITEA